MSSRFIFFTALASLFFLGTWRVLSLLEPIEPFSSSSESNNGANENTVQQPLARNNLPSQKLDVAPQVTKYFDNISALILAANAQQAAQKINQHYSELSSEELSTLKQSMLSLAVQQDHQKEAQQVTLIAASTAFNDINIWKLLATNAINLNNWPLAYDAQSKATRLENDSLKLSSHYERLMLIASQLKKQYQQNQDELSIKSLFENLSLEHPSYSRFQLEYALSLARLKQTVDAQNILKSLAYDPEFGDFAQATLKSLEATTETPAAKLSPKPTPLTNDPREILVPLLSSGSSFLIDTQINNKQARLLLDTGASITALSSQLIQDLQLERTSSSINISTANGVKRVNLFKAKQLTLGALRIQNLIVAEIDLSSNNFKGLLGTDVLNQIKGFDYVIDKQRNALIFKETP